ncbi:hypothetical protein, partial [Neisseria gonorrhoeae]
TFQVAATSPKSLSLLKHKPCGLLPSPQPSPAQGRERIAAGLAVAGGFKSSAGMTVFWFIY